MDRVGSDTETDDYEQPLLHRKRDDDIKRGEELLDLHAYFSSELVAEIKTIDTR